MKFKIVIVLLSICYRKDCERIILLLSLLDLPLLVDLQKFSLQIINCHRMLTDFVVYLNHLTVQIIKLIATNVAGEM